MKYLLFSFLAISLFLTSSCENDSLSGSRNIITDDRTSGIFTNIDVEDAFEVTVRQASETSVIVRADDNIIDRVNTSTSGGTLSVRLANGSYNNVTLEVEISMPNLDRLEFNDAIRGEVIGFDAGDQLDIVLNDASKLQLSGSANQLDLNISDASDLKAFNFTTGSCTVEVEDASKVEVTVNDRLEGEANDASEIRFKGAPVVDVDVSDASRVIDAN